MKVSVALRARELLCCVTSSELLLLNRYLSGLSTRIFDKEQYHIRITVAAAIVHVGRKINKNQANAVNLPPPTRRHDPIAPKRIR